MNILLISIAKLFGVNSLYRRSPVKKVGIYTLVKEIQIGERHPIFVGKYEGSGKQVCIKTWRGIIPDFDYYQLNNEWEVSREVKKILTRSSSIHINTPIPLAKIKTQTSISVVFEWIEAQSLASSPVKKQQQVVKYVEKEVKKVAKVIQSKKIHSRSVSWYAMIIILRLPFSNISLLKKIKTVTSLLNVWKKYYNQKLTFAHGDIVPKNILADKKTVWLIDFGDSCYTLPTTDHFYTLIHPNSPFTVTLNAPKNIVLAAVSLVSAKQRSNELFFARFI